MKAQHKRYLEIATEDEPHQQEKSGCEKPRHSDQRFWRFMMEPVTCVSESFTAMINPTMEAILEECPADKTTYVT